MTQTLTNKLTQKITTKLTQKVTTPLTNKLTQTLTITMPLTNKVTQTLTNKVTKTMTKARKDDKGKGHLCKNNQTKNFAKAMAMTRKSMKANFFFFALWGGEGFALYTPRCRDRTQDNMEGYQCATNL